MATPKKALGSFTKVLEPAFRNYHGWDMDGKYLGPWYGLPQDIEDAFLIVNRHGLKESDVMLFSPSEDPWAESLKKNLETGKLELNPPVKKTSVVLDTQYPIAQQFGGYRKGSEIIFPTEHAKLAYLRRMGVEIQGSP